MHSSPSDPAALAELGRRLARIRLDLGLSQAALADESGVSLSTVTRLEAGRSTQLTNFVRVLRGLNLLDDFLAFLPAAGPSPLEQLESTRRTRRRAPRRPDGDPAGTDWSWGE